MKTIILSLSIFLYSNAFSQLQAYSFVEKNDFPSADSVLTAVSPDPFYVFTFELFYPLSQALNKHVQSEQFVQYEIENSEKLKNLFQFYDTYIHAKQKKVSQLEFAKTYRDIYDNLIPSSYSYYALISSIQLLKADSKVSDGTIEVLLKEFETKWNDFITTDTSENLQEFRFLRTFIHYEYIKMLVTYGLQPRTLLFETDFSFELQQTLRYIPFFTEIWKDFDVFNDKFSLLEDASLEEQKIYSIIFLCETPTKENQKKVKKIFNDDELLVQELANEFDFFNPSIEFSDSIQNYIKANSKPGNWIVLDIWGTWCGPCVEELPTWQKFANKHSDSNFSLLLLSAYSEDWREFLQKNEYSLPNQEITKEEINTLGINSFPTTYLISPNGNAAIVPFGIEKTEYISVIIGI